MQDPLVVLHPALSRQRPQRACHLGVLPLLSPQQLACQEGWVALLGEQQQRPHQRPPCLAFRRATSQRWMTHLLMFLALLQACQQLPLARCQVWLLQ